MSGGKWLGIGALGLAVLVALLLHEMNAPAATAKVTTAPVASATPAPAPAPQQAAAAQAIAKVAAATAPSPPSNKIEAGTDKFIRVFTDEVPAIVSRKMMRTCYKGGLHRRGRNQSITINFQEHIRNGDVTFDHVEVDTSQSNLNDDQLQACFLAQFKNVKWHDDRLPDYDAPDQFTLNPERGGKKFLDEELNYVGADAPPNTPRD